MAETSYEPRNRYSFQTLKGERWDLMQTLAQTRTEIRQAEAELGEMRGREANLVEAIALTERELRRLERDGDG